MSEWDRTAHFVKEHFPNTLRIPTGLGNGRNERVMRYISESILEGYFGPDLRLRGYAFQREFFEEPLDEREFEATVESMETAERRNHPERFDEDGNYIYEPYVHQAAQEEKPSGKRLILMRDAEELLKSPAHGRI